MDEWIIDQTEAQLVSAQEAALRFMLFWYAVEMARREEQSNLAGLRAQIGVLAGVQHG